MKQAVLLLSATCLQVLAIVLFAQLVRMGFDPVSSALVGVSLLGYGIWWEAKVLRDTG